MQDGGLLGLPRHGAIAGGSVDQRSRDNDHARRHADQKKPNELKACSIDHCILAQDKSAIWLTHVRAERLPAGTNVPKEACRQDATGNHGHMGSLSIGCPARVACFASCVGSRLSRSFEGLKTAS